MKWTGVFSLRLFSTISFQAVDEKSRPDSMASSTRRAPWAKMRPAPKALCPTSLLPWSWSEGIPTAVPWAFSFRTILSWSRRWKRWAGLARSMALPG